MQEENKRITIKVNGKDKLVTEIRKDAEIAAALDKNSKDAPFDWVFPEDNRSSNVIHFSEQHYDKVENRYNSSYFPERTPGLPIHRKKRRLPLQKSNRSNNNQFQIPKKLLVPIAGAIIVGSIIGIIVLMIFTGKDFESQTPTAATSDIFSPERDATTDDGKSATSTTTIDLSMDTFIVQGGKFSTEENAGERIRMVLDSGYAAVRSAEENRVFIGIAPTFDAANELAADYESVVPDAYVPKGWTIEASDVPVPKGSNLSWVMDGKQLFEGLISINPTSMKEYETKINDWKKEALRAIKTLPAENQEKAVGFVNTLATLPEKSESKWDFQQGLLEIFVAYQTFILDLEG
ncbi:SPOR domain-containing protein [Alkalihalobacillus sp. AL-G]|uniref:SPOR domain-containing protein n=1 Tax=Alkalihalobacillus sp. AL-G TaxID=2926399 RepID=UPI00272D3959|nr:SPOR domain-containing protein [Alkalihalobacillus sp. AL-G]WLD92243.1 SPOR domain-containing protein [Alkalihalobacillus sp. AL-G]